MEPSQSPTGSRSDFSQSPDAPQSPHRSQAHLAEDTIAKELMILNRPCLIYWTLYLGLEKHSTP